MAEQNLPFEGVMLNPHHPCHMIRQDCIEHLGLSIGEATDALGVTRQALDHLVNKRGGVPPEMALRPAKAFGGTPEMWMRLKAAFDFADARNRKAKKMAAIRRLGRVKEPT